MTELIQGIREGFREGLRLPGAVFMAIISAVGSVFSAFINHEDPAAPYRRR